MSEPLLEAATTRQRERTSGQGQGMPSTRASVCVVSALSKPFWRRA